MSVSGAMFLWTVIMFIGQMARVVIHDDSPGLPVPRRPHLLGEESPGAKIS